ncbi:hypothetical protein [Nocardia sp. NPDC004260]
MNSEIESIPTIKPFAEWRAAAALAPASERDARLAKVLADNMALFDSSPQLRHVAAFARSRGAGVYATLGHVLMRVVAMVPNTVVLPPIIGTTMSLNQLIMFSGDSGGGKDAAIGAATDGLRYVADGRARTWRAVQPGTGEGLNRSYAKGEKVGGKPMVRFHSRAAMFAFRDVAAFERLAERQGATLVPELLKAAHGQELGFANADHDRRVILPAHSYRLCLSMGVQEGNGGALLNEQAVRDGLPQRLLWLPVKDGFATRRSRQSAKAAVSGPLTLDIPQFGVKPFDPLDPSAVVDPMDPEELDLVEIKVADHIADLIWDTNELKNAHPMGRLPAGMDPMAGHRLLTCEKVGAAFMALHGEMALSGERWQQAEALMAVSDAVAAYNLEAIAEADVAEDQRIGRKRGVQNAAAAAESAGIIRAFEEALASRVLDLLRKGGELAYGEISRNLSTNQKAQLGDVLTKMVRGGSIESKRTEYQTGKFSTKYRLVE